MKKLPEAEISVDPSFSLSLSLVRFILEVHSSFGRWKHPENVYYVARIHVKFLSHLFADRYCRNMMTDSQALVELCKGTDCCEQYQLLLSLSSHACFTLIVFEREARAAYIVAFSASRIEMIMAHFSRYFQVLHAWFYIFSVSCNPSDFAGASQKSCLSEIACFWSSLCHKYLF